MADINSDIFTKNVVGAPLKDSVFIGGRVRTVMAKAASGAIAADSKVFIVSLPSHGRLLKASNFHHGAFTGATGVTFGDVNNAAALMAATSFATAGTKPAIPAITTPNLNQRLWQMLGYSSDPNRYLDLFLTFTVASTNSGEQSIIADLMYVHD